MYTTSLRKVGGSVMIAVPPVMLDLLRLHTGSVVGLNVDGERLVIEPRRRPVYTLEKLLDECQANEPRSAEDEAWLNLKPMGGEL